jgi:hypothetical protein
VRLRVSVYDCVRGWVSVSNEGGEHRCVVVWAAWYWQDADGPPNWQNAARPRTKDCQWYREAHAHAHTQLHTHTYTRGHIYTCTHAYESCSAMRGAVPTQTDTGPRMAESVCICLYFNCVSEREREGGTETDAVPAYHRDTSRCLYACACTFTV